MSSTEGMILGVSEGYKTHIQELRKIALIV